VGPEQLEVGGKRAGRDAGQLRIAAKLRPFVRAQEQGGHKEKQECEAASKSAARRSEPAAGHRGAAKGGGRIANPPQVANLPHKNISHSYFPDNAQSWFRFMMNKTPWAGTGVA